MNPSTKAAQLRELSDQLERIVFAKEELQESMQGSAGTVPAAGAMMWHRAEVAVVDQTPEERALHEKHETMALVETLKQQLADAAAVNDQPARQCVLCMQRSPSALLQVTEETAEMHALSLRHAKKKQKQLEARVAELEQVNAEMAGKLEGG